VNLWIIFNLIGGSRPIADVGSVYEVVAIGASKRFCLAHLDLKAARTGTQQYTGVRPRTRRCTFKFA